MEVALQWQVRPTEFWTKWSEIDKAYAMALLQAKAEIQIYDAQIQEEEMRRSTRRSSSQSGRQFRGR